MQSISIRAGSYATSGASFGTTRRTVRASPRDVEHQYSVRRRGQAVNFREMVHRLPGPGRSIDPGDPHPATVRRLDGRRGRHRRCDDAHLGPGRQRSPTAGRWHVRHDIRSHPHASHGSGGSAWATRQATAWELIPGSPSDSRPLDSGDAFDSSGCSRPGCCRGSDGAPSLLS